MTPSHATIERKGALLGVDRNPQTHTLRCKCRREPERTAA